MKVRFPFGSLRLGLEQLHNQGQDHFKDLILALVVCFPFKPLYTARRQPTQQPDQIVLIRAAWQQDRSSVWIIQSRTFMYSCLGSVLVDAAFGEFVCRKADEAFQPPRCTK